MRDVVRESVTFGLFLVAILLAVIFVALLPGCAWGDRAFHDPKPLPVQQIIRVVPEVPTGPSPHWHTIPGNPGMMALHTETVHDWLGYMRRLQRAQARALGWSVPTPTPLLEPAPAAPPVKPRLPDPYTDTLEIRPTPKSRWFLAPRMEVPR